MGERVAGERAEGKQKRVVGRPFSKTNQPARRRGAAPEMDFGQLARKILTDPRAQRALLAKARRADLPAHVIKLLAESAAPAPEPPREERGGPTTGELADFLTSDVPPYYQRLLYDYWKGRLDERGRPVGETPPHEKAEPAPKQEEPALDPARPLAAASERLARQDREEFRGDTAEERQVVRAAEALDRLAAAREAFDAHPWEDRAHRAECRRCRETWRREALA